MNRLLVLVLALLLAACAASGSIPVLEPVSNAEIIRRADGLTATASLYTATAVAIVTGQAVATRNAQATLDAAQRDTVIIITRAAAFQTRSAAELAPELTRGAATQSAAVATGDAQQSATQFAAQETRTAADADYQRLESSVWLIVQVIVAGALTLAVSLAIIWIGRAVASNVRADKADRLIAFDERGGVTIVRMFNPHNMQWRVTSLPQLIGAGRDLKTIDAHADEVERQRAQLKVEWTMAIQDTARAAAIVGSWSVSSLSNRRGALGVLSEDALADITGILMSAGWLADYRGTRGIDWASGRSAVQLQNAIDDGQFDFDLPLTPSGEWKNAPEIRLSNATQSNAATHEAVVKSPMRRKKESM